MSSSTILNMGQALNRANPPFQVVTTIDSIFSTRTSTYAEPIEGYERGIVQRSRRIDQRIWTKDVRGL